MKKIIITFLTLLSVQQGFSQTAATTVGAPETISPNGDGVNDDFVFQFQNMEKVHVKIMDANGVVVANFDAANRESSSKDIEFKWTGLNMSGTAVKAGTYTYDIYSFGIDGQKYEKKGKISLTR